MPTALITAEFNPLHAGHARLLNEVRHAFPDALIVILMSGYFVQRGTPAVADRWTRAAMGLLAGADVVLELPAFYAVQGAAGFARGAVRTAAGLGADILAFGAETDSPEALRAAAELLREEPPAMGEAIREARRRGLNHGAALQKALEAHAPHLAPLLSGPNNTLGIEYLQAVMKADRPLETFIVHRSDDDGRRISARAVREALRRAPEPDAVLSEWGVPLSFEPAFLEEALYRLGLGALRLGGREALATTADVSDAVASRLLRAHGAPDYTAFVREASARWLPQARVRRALLSLVLRFTKDQLAAVNSGNAALHARLLGLRTEAETAFGRFAAKSSIPIVSSFRHYPSTTLAEGDQRAAALYATLRTPPEDPAAAQAHRVVKLDGKELLHL